MKAANDLNKSYSCNTSNNVKVDVTVGDGQAGSIDLYVGGVLKASGGDTLSYDFGKGSDLIGKTAAFHVVASQTDPDKTLTNVHYVFTGGATSPQAYDNKQILADGDTSTVFTDQFNFVK